MATQVQRRRGTTAEHATFTGALAETTIDTTKKTVVVHDGATVGGIPLARESDLVAGSIAITDAGGYFTGTDVEAALAELAAPSGALTYFTEARNTTVPNATVPVHSFTATGAETNIDAVLAPKGTGAIIADVPDSAATGGNKRGTGAVDFQTNRTVATQVASGSYSALIGGYQHTCSGPYAAIAGGEVCINNGFYAFIGGGSGTSLTGSGSAAIGGISNIVDGIFSAALGGTVNIQGNYNIASGRFAVDRGIDYCFVMGGNRRAVDGDSQCRTTVIRTVTTDATPTNLSDIVVLPDNHSYGVSALVTARNISTGDTSVWKVEGAIKRATGVATTVLVGTPSVSTLGTDAGMAGTSIALIADTTNGAVRIQVTGIAATTIHWVSKFDTVEVG